MLAKIVAGVGLVAAVLAAFGADVFGIGTMDMVIISAGAANLAVLLTGVVVDRS